MVRIAILLAMVAWIAAPFAILGRLEWPAGWSYFGALAFGLLAHRAYVARQNPGLRAARREIGPDTPGWDLVWNVVFWWLMAAAPTVAAAEHRARGASLPPWAWGLGVILLAVGLGLSAAAMAVNPFFEGTVRVQTERAQTVIETGPYARVRHPGYLGLCLWALATPLLLRSQVAFSVALVVVAWVVLRTALEDRLLRRGLAGYEAYTRKVRWRLLPGVW
jgi:protein-S-isoprenylcysteine O-methyltransferase Ste14